MELPGCRYCIFIASHQQGYQVREGRHTPESFPRCDLHWRFLCSECKAPHHFHGVAFCPTEDTFFCIHCAAEHKTPRDGFWGWGYYYRLKCPWHDDWHPALDRLEYEGAHPWQQEERWARELRGMSASEEISPLWSFSVQPAETVGDEDVRRGWDAVSEWWIRRYSPRGDINREWVIDPALFRLLGEVGELSILDAGCGNGYLARLLAALGGRLVGVDLSPKLLRIAQEQEEKEPLGIEYHEGDLSNLSMLEDASFDVAVSNVVLQDLRRLRKALQEIHRVLKPGGRFVFSITHPCFERPVPGTWVREPPDSERIEEWKHLAVDRYYDVVAVYWGPVGLPPSVGFHRPLQDFFQALAAAGFIVTRLQEPQGDEEALEKHYRHFADMRRVPLFLVVEAVKEKVVEPGTQARQPAR